jgi:hypothetical protein
MYQRSNLTDGHDTTHGAQDARWRRRTYVAPTASAHEFNGDSSGDGTSSDHDHTDARIHGSSSNVELLDYHSLGQRGPSSANSAESPHYGVISEMRIVGDYAYVCFFSSKNPTNNRGMGVIDISEFTAADNTSDLRDAEIDFVAFVRKTTK